jgi:hypothetical protein
LPKVNSLPKVNVLGWLLFVAANAALLVLLSAQSANAEGTSFRDDFDSFDSTRWIKSDHSLQNSYLDPDSAFHSCCAGVR